MAGNKSGAGHKNTGKRFDPNFYTLPPWPFIIMCPIIQYFFVTTTFAPKTFPAWLGVVGSYARDAGVNHHNFFVGLMVVMYGAHAVLAIRAARLCRELQMTESASRKWTMSVAFFGIFSFSGLQSFRKSKAA